MRTSYLCAAIISANIGFFTGAGIARAEDALAGAENLPPSEQIHAIGNAARADGQRLSEPLLRPGRMLDLAEAQIGAHDSAGAQETLKDARVLLDATNPMRVDYTVRMAKLLVAAGDLPSAHEMLDPRPFKGGLAEVLLSDGARALAKVGDFEGALALAKQLPVSADVLADIAARQCHTGNGAGKTALAAALDATRAADAKTQSHIARGVAYGMAACGDTAGAVALISELDPGMSARDLSAASHWLTRLGDFSAAQAMTKARVGTYDYAGLMELAWDQIDWGDFAAARSTLLRASAAAPIKDTGLLAATPGFSANMAKGDIFSIFGAQLAAKAFDDATRTAEGYDRMNGPSSLIHVVEAEVNQRSDADLERTLAVTIEKFRNLDDWPLAGLAGSPLRGRSYYFAELATVLGRAGYIDKARQALALALEFRHETEIPPDGGGNFEGIAQAQAAVGDIDDALATVAARNGRFTNTAYRKIAEELAGRGDAKRAFEVLGMVRQPNDYDRRLVAMRFVEAGDDATALFLAQQMTRPDDRFEVLLRMLDSRRL